MASPPIAPIAPPPSKDIREYFEEFVNRSTVAANLLTLACFVAFAFLIGCDVWRAFRKRAIWLPGKAFSLSGVTVQIIVRWTSLSNIQNGYKKQFLDLIWYHYMVVSGRVAVCVFIGYLLPGMAAPSLRVFGALAITICAQIASELFLLYNPTHIDSDNETDDASYQKKVIELYVEFYKRRITWSRVADLMLLMCVVVLGLILCCTIIASKTIHGLLSQRISAIAQMSKFGISNEQTKSTSSITQEEGFLLSTNWDDFEDDVLRSWFSARVCRIDYVVSRSVLSSAVWVVVTICVIVFYKSPVCSNPTLFPLHSFIILGWVVICWRWLAAQLYCLPRRGWRSWLCMEGFWTSRTVELIAMYDLKRERQQFQKSKSKMVGSNKSPSLLTRIFTKVRLHKLLYLVFTVQVCVVFFSKVCGILSEVTVGKFVYCCRRLAYCCCCECIVKEDPDASHKKYREMLEYLCMPGEDPDAMWEANRTSLTKAKRLMKKSCKIGSSNKAINSILSQRSVQCARDGVQLLNLLKEKALPSVLSYFPSVEKQCLKLTVVSLITIFIGLHKAKSDRLTKVMKACHEVWDLVSLADECDIDLQADNINLLDDFNRDKDQVLLAAEKELYKLQMKYHKLSSGCEDSVLDVEEVRKFLKDLQEKCKYMLREENLLQPSFKKFPTDLCDSRNWTKIAPSYTLNKLCDVMLEEEKKDFSSQDFVKWTEESLMNVIACSISRLPEILVKQCWIWAQQFEEDKLWEAIYLAGKCRGMMEEWSKDSTMTTRQHKTLYQRLKMCILCGSVKESPSPGDQTVSNTDQCTIEVKELPSQGGSPGTR